MTTSESPPLASIKRLKSKPTQRTRPSSPDPELTANHDEQTSAVSRSSSPSVLAAKLKSKVKKAQPKSRLSFGGADDEEENGGGAFQVKKSSLSQRMSLGNSKSKAATVDLTGSAAILSNRGPTYDKEYLQQLKASTPSLRSITQDPDVSYDRDMATYADDLSMAGVDSYNLDETENAASIPSESSIKVAKEKRDRLRKTGGEEDFISLSVSRRQDFSEGPHPESRLVREEDELGEGEDEFAEYTSAQERIALGRKSRQKEAIKLKETMKEMIEDADEEDEETAEWENEQLRRGGHHAEDVTAASQPVYKAAPIPPSIPIPTMSFSLDRLTKQLSQLSSSHAFNTTTLSTLAQERTQLDDRETELREMVRRAEEKRFWFVGFREWLESVATFLDEKYPELETLQQDHIFSLQKRQEIILKRRAEKDEDDLSTFIGPIPPDPTVIEETGEAARTIPKSTKASHRAEYLARKRQRIRQVEVDEGYSTDSSLDPQDEAAYRSAIVSLRQSKKGILADVKAEEFRDPGKGRWNIWREKYSESYVGAWGGLGVVSVWEFWAKLECCGWDPLEDTRSLDSFNWYEGLYAYSRPSPDDSEELGPDGDLVTSMITTAIIPWLAKVVGSGALDPYSAGHIKRAIELIEELEVSVEKDNPKMQLLFKAVIDSFDSAISSTINLIHNFTAIPQSAPFDPEAVPARQRFLNRRLKLLNNLVQWQKFTGDRFGVSQLIKKLLDRTIVKFANEGWDVGGEEVIKKIRLAVPGSFS